MRIRSSDADLEARLRHVAAHGLARSGLRGAFDVPEDSWPHLLTAVKAERLSGHLVAAIGDSVTEPPTVYDRAAQQQHRGFMVAAVKLESMVVQVVAELEDRGIEHRVLKGVAACHLDYPDPSLRCFGDADLLVRAQDIDRVVSFLQGCGFVRRYRQPRPGFDRRFGKSVSMVSSDGVELDLHRTLALGPYGVDLQVEDLWAESEMFAVAGHEVLALGKECRLLHACYHAALGDPAPRLTALRDIAQMLETHPELDVDRVRERAIRWGGAAVLARAIDLTRTAFDLEPTDLSTWAEQHRPERREQRKLRLYTDPSMSYAARAWWAIRSTEGMRSKAAFALALALPTEPVRDGVAETAPRRWWRRLRHVLRASR